MPFRSSFQSEKKLYIGGVIKNLRGHKLKNHPVYNTFILILGGKFDFFLNQRPIGLLKGPTVLNPEKISNQILI